ncbi:MAG: AAA family ATPase [Desertifilum sp.]|nr:AAA family ATPase [Desertifilum sp.]
MTLTTTVSGYQLTEQLYCGSRTLVYRAIREADRHPVIIKLLQRERPSLSELLLFRNQYTIAKNLNLPGIVKPYTLESCRHSYALVMEDFNGISLKEYIEDRRLPVDEFLAIAIQLADILYGLYHQSVIHKDLKPANILINPKTRQVKLIDFSISSLLPRETQATQPPNGLEGTLAYLSPEQTGRMNRGIDYRSDFYALGVTFFELLAGELPFASQDPMELVHCHVAKQPPLLHEILPTTIPQAISEIVMKLMAKNAEDRYQSALGLKYDLEHCWQQLQENGKIAPFTLGERDICDRFLIPEKLYGRQAEVQTLLAAFDRVSQGTSEMMLIAGFSGIGKTAVVCEVHKPIVRQRGYFIQGKFNQFGRNLPFWAFVQAFQDLMAQLLSETDEQLARWKTKILAALGDNAQVLIQVIPELEQVIGPQPPASELSGEAAQNRFNLLFHKFIHVFATPDHPLVIFLDDLQWADSASLKLIQLSMGENQSGHLLLIGAYRDNEVSAAHPLMLTLNEVRQAGAVVNAIALAPLAQSDLNWLVADTLSCPPHLAAPLTELVYQKTQGNPFFATQFLKALHEEGAITFNRQLGYWQCNMPEIRQLALTEDVVAFMALRLQKLSPSTQNVLKLAACIGNTFDLATLAIVCQQSQAQTALDLWPALQEGLILPLNEMYRLFQSQQSEERSLEAEPLLGSCVYKFLHDRVQQAAYSLIPAEQKEATHLQIGQLLLKNRSPEDLDSQIFEIVNQLNMGMGLLVQPSAREELTHFNLLAAHKAKAATAYTAALNYLNIGMQLLEFECWQNQYDLTLAIYQEAAEVAYLSSQFEQMQAFIDGVLQNARTLLDKIPVYDVKLHACMARNHLLEAIQTGLQVLQLLGLQFPENPHPSEIQAQLQATLANLGDRSPLDLLSLPQMSDRSTQAALQILSGMAPCAYQAAPLLLPLIVSQQVNLSIQYGNSALSAPSYAYFGVIVCGVLEDIETGYAFGQLALSLLNQPQMKPIQARTTFVTNAGVLHWREPVRNTLDSLQSAYTLALETGDLEFAALSTYIYAYHAYLSAAELSVLEQEIASYSQVLWQLKQKTSLNLQQILHQAILHLMEPTEQPAQLIGAVYNEQQMLPQHQQVNDTTAIFYLYFHKLVLSYLFEQVAQAVENADIAETYINGVTANFVVAPFYFYDALAHLASWNQTLEPERHRLLDRIERDRQKMQKWAHYAPANHQHKRDLIEAEWHRVFGDKAQAIEYYDRAIASAKAHEFLQEEAIANELAAKFYLDWGKERLAQTYLIDAYYCYARWGATAKVNQLEQTYPTLLAPILQSERVSLTPELTIHTTKTLSSVPTAGGLSTSSSGAGISAALDLASILKASQALSGEIQLTQLLTTLLQVAIENAGADKCALLLLKQDRLVVEALHSVDGSTRIQLAIPLEESQELPIGFINTVKRTLKPTVVANAIAHPSLMVDPYILRQQPKSLLCLPILHQGQLQGILYLENQLAAEAFTSDRVEILNLLCTQAAISLANAHLYQQSQAYAHQLEQSLEKLRKSENRFQKLSDNIPGVIYRIRIAADGSASMPYISSGCYDLCGVRPEEILSGNNSLRALEHPEDRQGVQQAILHSAQHLTPFRHEWRIITPTGEIKWVQAVSQPEQQPDGTLVWDGVMIDITERKRIEAEQIQTAAHLRQKSQELQQALENLQSMQLQLVQNEKMSALGNLVAGVAHEINNPASFITGNLEPAKIYIQDLLGLLDLYQQKLPNPDAEILDEIEAIDLEYLRTDLPKLIESMDLGVERICSISNSLRTFSRADRDYKVPFNIHEGLESTLLILKHRLKANEHRPPIQVIREYGDLPLIPCFPGQLNQVFMNLLANAIDALEESNVGQSFQAIEARSNWIKIKTRSGRDRSIAIQIADNGVGMSEAVQQRIFDHLFTTKPVGQGTGLGLAIARQIVVEKHGGTLEVKSALNQGTEFEIVLPID